MQLHTPRLLLSALDRSDLETFTALHADVDVTRYLSPPRPLTGAESFRLFAQILGHWQLRGYGYWAIRHRQTHEWLGVAGLWFPVGWPDVELGWRLFPSAWKQGYAREAGEILLEHAFHTLRLKRVVSIIHAQNARSIALAGRLGLREEQKKVVATTALVIFAKEAAASPA